MPVPFGRDTLDMLAMDGVPVGQGAKLRELYEAAEPASLCLLVMSCGRVLVELAEFVRRAAV